MKGYVRTNLKRTVFATTAFAVAALTVVGSSLLVSSSKAAAATQSTWMVIGNTAVNPFGTKVAISNAVSAMFNTIRISPNGQRLAYELKSAPGTIVTSNVDGTNRITIASMGSDKSYLASRMAWSRDSLQLAMPLGHGQQGLYDVLVMNASGSGSRRVTIPNGSQSQRIAWVSNTKLMYAQQTKVCTIQTDGTGNGCIAVNNLPAGQSGGAGGCITSINDAVLPSASSSWMLVYIGCGSQGLYRISTSLTDLKLLIPDPNGGIFDYAFSPDASRFAYLSQLSGASPVLNTMNIDGTGRQFEGSGFTQQTLSWGGANSIFEPVASTPGPAPTPSPSTTPGGNLIQSQYSSRCLDVDTNGGGLNGSKVQLWDCVGNANQRWTLNANGTISTHYGGRCLDVDTNGGGVNGNKVQVWDCVGGANQRWNIVQ